MAKMWQGRFKKELDSAVNAFNSSISFDYRMYKSDIEGSIAHSAMLNKQGILSDADKELIHDGLNSILKDIENGSLEFDMTAEDIHMFIEAELTKRIGDAGKRLHTARSRNDQVATDIRLYLRDEIKMVKDLIIALISVILDIADENTETIMPGYTHLQRAQPITLAHQLMAYAEMFTRDIDRLCDTAKRLNSLPLGACALAGTTHNIDRFYTAELLKFDSVCRNSIDAVSDRDFVIELASAFSLIMMHLSRFSEEIILWCSHEFKFIELDDAYATGSSIMPQKKNPDIAELVRGKTGRVYGDLMTLLTVMKGLPLAYNKDMQEDKEAIFDALDNTKLCLSTFIPMLKTLKVNEANMLNASKKGFINATDAADYLTKKGVPFRDAYKATGELVGYCVDNDLTLEELSLEEFKRVNSAFDNDIYAEIDLKNCVNKRNVYGAPSSDAVKANINELRVVITKFCF